MKTLLIISPEVSRTPQAEQYRREAADESTRSSYFDDMIATDIIDGAYLKSLTGIRSWLYRPLPPVVVQSLEAYRRRRDYDAVISWDDRVALVYGLLLTVTGSSSRHVAMLNWMIPTKKRMLLRVAQRRIDRIIVWNEMHLELLSELFGVARSKLAKIPYLVDVQFWRPGKSETDQICAAGNSQRDYATLIQAMDGLPMPCRIASSVSPRSRKTPDWNATMASLTAAEQAENIILGPASQTELRAIYARSRFVVIPLIPNFRDCGITVADEAMAMGKAIICTRTLGMADIIEHGVNGLFVPPGDPQALREAIQYLWERPDLAERMGEEGRRRAESIFALERFTDRVKQVVEEAIATPAYRRGRSIGG